MACLKFFRNPFRSKFSAKELISRLDRRFSFFRRHKIWTRDIRCLTRTAVLNRRFRPLSTPFPLK